MQGVDMRGMASWIATVGIGVMATGCPPGGKGGTGPGNGSNGVVIPAGIPKLADLDRLRLAQRDALPFEGLVPRNFCFAPPAVDPATIDVDRSLFVHDRATLDAADFSLKRTLGKIAGDAAAAGAAGATAE